MPNDTQYEPDAPDAKAGAEPARLEKNLMARMFVLVCGVFLGSFALRIVFDLLQPDSWVVATMADHPAAFVALPLAMVEAFFIVVLLKHFAPGPIELDLAVFKFRGASGPIVLWVVCFAALITGVWLLW